jgi:hypothetical protein
MRNSTAKIKHAWVFTEAVWKSRVMVDRYAKFGTEHLTVALRESSGDVTKT